METAVVDRYSLNVGIQRELAASSMCHSAIEALSRLFHLLLLLLDLLSLRSRVAVDLSGGLADHLLQPLHQRRQLVGELVRLPQCVHDVLRLGYLRHHLVIPGVGSSQK